MRVCVCVFVHVCVIVCVCVHAGKITSLDTSSLRASMKPGWEDLVRRCIQRFHLQNDGEMSFAKRHQQEGKRPAEASCIYALMPL